MALTQRFGRVQPFLRTNSAEDNRYGGLQAGVVTYSGDSDNETYQVSYAELGGRSDHIAKPIGDLVGADVAELSSSSPLASDADLIRQPKEEKKDDKKGGAPKLEVAA